MDACNRLPADPLKDRLLKSKGSRGTTWDELAQRVGVSSRTLMRVMSATTVSECVADRMAIRLGLHPVLIWPAEWNRGTKEEVSANESVSAH